MRYRFGVAAGVVAIVAIGAVFLLRGDQPEVVPPSADAPAPSDDLADLDDADRGDDVGDVGSVGGHGYLGFDDGYVTVAAIADQARALGWDPDRIFGFVRDEIAFESYEGILRGALGTLRGRAGNGADQAVLLHALLRESGRDVRFAKGRLAPVDAAELLSSMFTPRLTPAVPLTDAERSGVIADPAGDPVLLSEAGDHVWVQMSTPTGWVDLDPAFPNGDAGAARAAAEGFFVVPPADWYHHLELRVRLERIANDELMVIYPLVHEVRVADVAGERLGFGHGLEEILGATGVEAADIGRVLAARQRRYQPLLRIGDLAVIGDGFAEAEGFDPDSPIGQIGQALGGDPAEFGPVTGEWLELRFTTPGGVETLVERVVFDRLGPAARERGDLERLARQDVTQILLGTYFSMLVAPYELSVAETQTEIGAVLEQRLLERAPLERRLASLQEEGIEAEVRRFLEDTLLPHDFEAWFDLAHATNQLMAAASDAVLAEERDSLAVRAYPDQPRVFITHLAPYLDVAEDTASFGIDLRHLPQRVLAYPGVDRSMEIAYQFAHGLVNGVLEGSLIELLTGGEVESVAAIFAAAADQGVGIVWLGPDQASQVGALQLPADVRARLQTELENGYAVTLPASFVTLPTTGDAPRSGWWRQDLQSGAVVAVLDNGLHPGFNAYESVVSGFILGKVYGPALCANCPTIAIDVLVGFDHALLAFGGEVLKLIEKDNPLPWNTLFARAFGSAAATAVGDIRNVLIANLGQGLSAPAYAVGVGIAMNHILRLGP